MGGSKPWKFATAAQWVVLAHAYGKRCHVGRVGSFKRVRWAIEIEADSIDSSLPLWSKAQLKRFLAALHMQQDMLW